MEENMTSLDKLNQELNNRPWYQKLWTRIIFFHWICNNDVLHVIMKKPINQKAIDQTANWIKDDLEFGYTVDMIYDKIKLGNYDNTPEKKI